MVDPQPAAEHTLKARLAAAIQRWGGPRAVAAFCRAMEERGVRGATRTAVHQVLGGKHAPSLDFIAQAGDVLGVRAAWLAWGEAPITPEEAQFAAEIVRQAIICSDTVESLVQARAHVEDELILNNGGDDGEG